MTKTKSPKGMSGYLEPVVAELLYGMELGNCTVVTTDSDLSALPGLEVENWEVNVQQ